MDALIMETARGDCEDLLSPRPNNTINETVLTGNSASAPSCEVTFKRFRLADTLERGSARVFDHRV